MTGNYVNSFMFSPVSSSDIISIMHSMRNKKAPLVSIPIFVLEKVCCMISPIIAQIVNLSLSTGSFSSLIEDRQNCISFQKWRQRK